MLDSASNDQKGVILSLHTLTQQALSHSSSGNCIIFIGKLNCIWEQSLQVYGQLNFIGYCGNSCVYSKGNECHICEILCMSNVMYVRLI